MARDRLGELQEVALKRGLARRRRARGKIVDVLEAADEERPARRVERVVAPVPREDEALRGGEARTLRHEQELRGVGVDRRARGGLALEVLRDRLALLKQVHEVVLEALREEERELAHRAEVDVGDGGDLGDVEIALEVVDEDAVEARADERAEADLGEREARRDARGDARVETGLAERREVRADLVVEDERRGQVRQLHAQREADGGAEDVAVAVLEVTADAFAGGQKPPRSSVSRQELVHRDDDGLFFLRHVRIAQRDAHARKDAQGRDALLRRARVARAVRLADLQRDAAHDRALARDDVAADDDRAHDDALALRDREHDAGARVVDGALERVLHVGVREALLAVQIEDAAARFVELERAHRIAEAHVGRDRDLGFGDLPRAVERDVVQRRPRAELDRDAQPDVGLALDAVHRVGHARERRGERLDGQRQVRRIVGASILNERQRCAGTHVPAGERASHARRTTSTGPTWANKKPSLR